jgi:predicted transcriptional regulator
MQLHSEVDMQASNAHADALSASKRRPKRSRKVTIRLTEELYNRFSAATERPGAGKSMVVEAALERFLSVAPSIEDTVRDRFDDIDDKLNRLEKNMRIMAETVALHARYHLSVMPPLPQARQQEAAHLGDERFKVLAEQVDRRVRHGRPLMQETIDRLDSSDCAANDISRGPNQQHRDQGPATEEVDIKPASFAAAGEGGGTMYFRQCPSALGRPA